MPDATPPDPAPRMTEAARALLREIVREEFLAYLPTLERRVDLFARGMCERLEAAVTTAFAERLNSLGDRLVDEGDEWKRGTTPDSD